MARGHRKLRSTLSTHTWTSQTGAALQNVPPFHRTLSFPPKCMQQNSCKAAMISSCDSSFPVGPPQQPSSHPQVPLSRFRSTLWTSRQERWSFVHLIIIVLQLGSLPHRQSSDPVCRGGSRDSWNVAGCEDKLELCNYHPQQPT